MEELPLLIFTIFLQAAIGILLFTAIAGQFNKEATFKVPLVTAAGMAVVGVLASMLHLGRPFAAIHALAGFGTSWLSREIWFSAVFTGLAIFIVLLVLFRPSLKRLIKILIPLAALVGLIDIYAMASSYSFASVPVWKSSATFIQFYATMISVGAALFLGLSGKEAINMSRGVIVAACAAIGVQAVAMINYYLQLGENSSEAAQQSVTLLKSMNIELMLQWILILAGTGLVLATLRTQKESAALDKAGTSTATKEAAIAVDSIVKMNGRILLLGLSALTIGQIVGRYLFYAVMVTSKVGLN